MAAVDPGAFSPQALPPHPATPERGAGPNRASLLVRRLGWGTGVLLLALTFLPFPVPAPDNQVDGSLAQVLSWAWQSTALFGQDLIFTYGPLGKFIFFYYTSSAAGWRLIIDVALGVTVALGLCLVAARMPRPWAIILLLSFVWVAPNLPARADFLLNAALFCWGTLCFPHPGHGPRGAVPVFAVLAAFAALAKVSFLFSATGAVVLTAWGLISQGRARTGLGLVGAYASCLLAGFALAGQPLANLPALLRHEWALVQAYNGALGGEALDPVMGLGWLALAMTAATALWSLGAADEGRGVAQWQRRLPWALWSGFLVAIAFKHGFVRPDHAFFFFPFAAVAALTLAGISGRNPARRTQITALLTTVTCLYALHRYYFPSAPPTLTTGLRAAAGNLRLLIDPVAWWNEMDAALEQQRQAAQLPKCRERVGAASVDVFGQSQAFALWNDLAYRPRPVFQSYVACSGPLSELNERFYLSSQSPEFVLFELAALDRKLPPLEDSRVLRHLLINYRPVVSERNFVLLEQQTWNSAQLRLLRQGTVRPGEPIDLSGAGDAGIWLEVWLQPSGWGRLRQIVLRPPTVRTAFWTDPGGNLVVRKRAPASMMSGGFLASPLMLANEDLLRHHAGEPTRRPGACTIELPPGDERWWNTEIRYRVSIVQNLRPGSGDPAAPATPEARFRLFPSTRWRPDRPTPNLGQPDLAYLLFLALPVGFASGLAWLRRRLRNRNVPAAWTGVALGNVLLLGGLVSLLLLAGETYFRFFYNTTDSLGYTLLSERWVRRHWHTNRAGSRDNLEYAPARPSATPRVSFLGDSFTAGHGVRDVDTRFVNLLRQQQPSWEIHAIAAVGLDTGSEIRVLSRALAKGYQLDTVVLVYCLNDIGDLLENQQTTSHSLAAAVEQSTWIVRHSYFLNLLYHRFHASRHEFFRDYSAVVRDAYDGAVWDQQRRRFKELKTLVESHGAKLKVVTFPFLHALAEDYPYAHAHERLATAWRELDVPHLDLLPLFQHRDPRDVTVNPHDAHPNELAHRLAAGAISAWLTPQIAPAP